MDCLGRNRDSEFGQQYGLSDVQSVADYQNRVPLGDYESLSPWIQRMLKGETDVLFSGDTLAFELTSGSTAAQKLIPYSQESLHDFRRALWPWLAGLPDQFSIHSGKAYWAISPATRQTDQTASGIPIGLADSAYLGAELTAFFIQVSAVPFWVGTLEDFGEWQLATLYFLICADDLSLISVWSPIFLSSLIDSMIERRAQLEQLLSAGMTLHARTMPADAAALQRFRAYCASQRPKDLWPQLKLISCWAHGSSCAYYQDLVTRFDPVTFQPKGLLSTEAVVTVPDHENRTLLTPHSAFYEFIDEQGCVHLAHELQTGQSYQVLLTTAGGLYRYRSGDCVRCRDYVEGLPQLEFIGRRQTSDLAGEKLSEAFVTSCLKGIAGFRLLLPLSKPPGYCLVVESVHVDDAVCASVEQALCANPHYAYARKLGQLQPLKLLVLDHAAAIYRDQALQRGARLGDIKPPSLCLDASLFADDLQRII